MTFRTSEVAAVILWFERQGCMLEVGWCPGIGVVAGSTFLRRQEVTSILACRSDAVVAGRAGPEYLVVVNSDHRLPDGRTVAILANIGGQDMCLPLARCVRTVVAV